MKDFIFDQFSNKLNSEKDIENTINLIDCLEGKDKKIDTIYHSNKKDKEKEAIKNEFLEKLIQKKFIYHR